MLVGNVLFSPKPIPENNQIVPKAVAIYKLGSSPEITYQGKVEKSGVIKIVAQIAGVVSSINVIEGQKVSAGENILSLATNYSGGNASSISREIAQTQYQNAQDSFPTQKDVIVKQRDSASKNQQNSDLQRQITTQSATDTQAIFDLDKSIVDSLSQNIKNLESANVGGVNDTAILQAKEALVSFQAAMNQTNSSFQSLQIQASDNTNASSVNAFEISLKQLDLQEKALEMNLNIAKLQYNLASVLEQNMFPSSPFSGVVDKIFVHVGDKVSVDTLLASISGDNQHAEVVVLVPQNIAKSISVVEPSILSVGGKIIKMTPTYISKDATSGVLYSVIYDLNDSLTGTLTDASFVNVKIPVGVANTTNIDPFIPLDSVIQTQEEAFVYVADNGIANVKKITLGQIQGRFVEVLSGLPKEAQVIIDRNVIAGDKIQVIR
jgi:multidrug efflux pump subunit AcrA (membrane-fusion protein)